MRRVRSRTGPELRALLRRDRNGSSAPELDTRVDQCEHLPDSIKTGEPMRVRNPDAPEALADPFLRSTGADIREGHGAAYYVPSQNFISMPAFQAIPILGGLTLEYLCRAKRSATLVRRRRHSTSTFHR